jgi:putative membrane protein insertion efficiency factor
MTIHKRAVIFLLRFYQKVLSPDKGILSLIFPIRQTCTMYPTCSDYMIQAIEKYGVGRGMWKGVRRILRCHPYQKKLIDEP